MSSIASRIRGHLLDRESSDRKILVGFIWVSLFVFIGKLAGAAKEMALAWRYGVSETVDAYVFVFNLVNWPVAVWFSVLTVVLVPLVAHLRHDNPGELPRFRRELLGLTIILGAGLGILAYFGLPALLQAQWLGLADTAITEALRLSRGLALLVPMGALVSLFSAWLLASSHHRNTLFEAIPALTILIALLLPAGWIAEPLLWGTVVGFALHIAALAAPLQRKRELHAPSFAFRSSVWQGFLSGLGIMMVGQVLMSFTSIIDQFFAAQLSPGALSTLSYANRILALILGMVAMAISRATLPAFSAAYTRHGAEVDVLALRWAKWMFALAMCVVIAVWPLSTLIVQILFERGSFQSEDTESVANLLRCGLLQLPFYAAGLVLVSALSSKKKYKSIALISLLNVAIKVTTTYFLVVPFEVAGILFSNAIMHAISTTLCLVSLLEIKKGFRLWIK